MHWFLLLSFGNPLTMTIKGQRRLIFDRGNIVSSCVCVRSGGRKGSPKYLETRGSAQWRFASVVLDDVLEPPILAPHTLWCPNISVFLDGPLRWDGPQLLLVSTQLQWSGASYQFSFSLGTVYKGRPPIFGLFWPPLPPCPLFIHSDLNPPQVFR